MTTPKRKSSVSPPTSVAPRKRRSRPTRAKASRAADVEIAPIADGAHERTSDTRAFIETGHTTDPLAAELGETTIRSITSGEDDPPISSESEQLAEVGGPFVVTDGGLEMADDEEPPNIADAERAPSPTSRATDEDETDDEKDDENE